jgi:hypothetical protein
VFGTLNPEVELRVQLSRVALARFSLQGWGLTDLPLRASNEGWFTWSISIVWLIGLEIHPDEPGRPVVARSASKEGTWPLPLLLAACSSC